MALDMSDLERAIFFSGEIKKFVRFSSSLSVMGFSIKV